MPEALRNCGCHEVRIRVSEQDQSRRAAGAQTCSAGGDRRPAEQNSGSQSAVSRRLVRARNSAIRFRSGYWRVLPAGGPPFRIEEIRRLAIELAKADPVVTGFYEWGPWVNGGAWIETDICKVDLLYRNLDQLEETIGEAHAGRARHDFDQQPPFGFRGVIYLGELDCCIPLYDPAEELARLKRAVEKYPPALKHTIVGDSLWGAEFTLLFARGFARAGDVFNTVGCLTRIGHYLVQALFALNERYFVNDKRVFEAMADFGLMPTRFQERIDAVLAHAGASAAELGASIEMTAALWRETVGLAGSLYQRCFALESLT